MLQIIVLTGGLQGDGLSLFDGLKISAKDDADLKITDEVFLETEFIIECSSSGDFAIYSVNNKPLISTGTENVPRLNLMPGLIFSINEVGFSVQEDNSTNQTTSTEKQMSFAEAFESLNQARSTANFHLLKQTLSLKFARGAWVDSTWALPWLPISFGKKSSLYFFIDESIPINLDFLHLDQDQDSKNILIKSDIPNFISVNGALITNSKEVTNGDLIEFGQTAFYIELK